MTKKKEKKERTEKKEIEIYDDDSDHDFQNNDKKYYTEDKIDDVLVDIMPKLKDYIKVNALCIGESLDYIDILNFIEYISQ